MEAFERIFYLWPIFKRKTHYDRIMSSFRAHNNFMIEIELHEVALETPTDRVFLTVPRHIKEVHQQNN